MPGPLTHYKLNGRRRRRRTPYYYIPVREHDRLNIRKLADKMSLTIVDAVHQVVADRLRELHVEPLTPYGFAGTATTQRRSKRHFSASKCSRSRLKPCRSPSRPERLQNPAQDIGVGRDVFEGIAVLAFFLHRGRVDSQ